MKPSAAEQQNDALDEERLRKIMETLTLLRSSHAPMVQNYAISVMAETEALLLMSSLNNPPGLMAGEEGFYRDDE